MRSLITGGAGFIGSYLAEELLRQGHDVSMIDDLSTGSIENIEHLKRQYGILKDGVLARQRGLSVVASGNARFQYTIDTVMNVPLLAELVDQCDVVYHLAAAVGVKLIVESPVRTIETNVRGTEVVLELANKKKKKVFLASTSEVYGKASKIPFSEDDDLVIGPTVKGRWAYACSKALDEFLAIAYWKEKRLPVVVVRLFNTVGPRQTGQYGMVLPNFVRQALAGEPITVYGDGTQSRSFTYVEDVVDALIKLAMCDRAVGQVFNVGNGTEVTIGDLARKVKSIAKSNSEIQYVPYSQVYGAGFEDMPRRVPDIRKIRDYIEWEPQVQLEEIIRRVIHHYSDRV
ncbi:MAG: GDP-mannose 4,6-dehydratase [Acidobacteria bacterium]|nr:GDP-mannose 4,6-dehydratase [Acidobacteriota bacterium]